jgi:hypothetical protein
MKIKDPQIKKLLEEHKFPEDRGLNEYIEIFGFPFANAIKSLKTMSHWLDAGAGGGRAIKEYLLVTSKNDVFTTAVTLQMSEKISSPTHKTIVNYLEDLTQENVRACDIITDVTGGLQYSEQPDHLLKRYFLWLKPEGQLFLYVKPDSTVIERNGSNVSMHEWIKSLPGVDAKDGSVEGSLILSKKGSYAFPRLKLIETQINEDLFRKFKE